MRTQKNRIIVGIISTAVCILIYCLVIYSSNKDRAGLVSGQPIEVSVVTIKEQTITSSKDLPGRTSAIRIAEIRPQVNGIILKRFFTEGALVKKGEQLYQIDPAPYKAAYASAKADLMKAEANNISNKLKKERYVKLVKIGGVSKQEYDDAKAQLSQSEADIAIAKANLASAKINLDYTKVLSPISGRIGYSLVTEGALVTANQADSLTNVQQLDNIYVDAQQLSTEIMQLQKQLDDNIEDESRPKAHLLIDDKIYGEPGALQFSDITVNPSTGMVQLRILFPNPDYKILPGLFVHVRLEQSKDEAAILVPQKAISRSAEGVVTVWTVDANNKVAVRPIKISTIIGDQWRVVDGLKVGDVVVVEGIMKIHPNSIVKTIEKAPAQSSEKSEASANNLFQKELIKNRNYHG